MNESKSLSADVCTHQIFYKDGDNLKSVRVFKEEAEKAIEKWDIWRPVPIPNRSDPNLKRSYFLTSSMNIDSIKRISNPK